MVIVVAQARCKNVGLGKQVTVRVGVFKLQLLVLTIYRLSTTITLGARHLLAANTLWSLQVYGMERRQLRRLLLMVLLMVLATVVAASYWLGQGLDSYLYHWSLICSITFPNELL